MVVEVQNTPVVSASGERKNLGQYSKNVILIVNVASYCGNTAQYNDLQKLNDKSVSYTHLTLPTIYSV